LRCYNKERQSLSFFVLNVTFKSAYASYAYTKQNLFMKTIIIILSLFVLNTSVYAFKHDGSLYKAYSQKIKNAISVPSDLKQKSTNQKVTVYFKVNEQGTVTEVNAKTRNRTLKADIEKQFKGLNLKGLQTEQFNSIDLNIIVY